MLNDIPKERRCCNNCVNYEPKVVNGIEVYKGDCLAKNLNTCERTHKCVDKFVSKYPEVLWNL